ncbi:MAG TPA: hypothetical protein VLM40_16870, partial [Gemmata sp.]|nr:hypothetical protein [Gemmata sp.]
PQLQRPTVTQPASSSASTETGEKSSKWPWVLLLVVLSGLFAGCAFLVVKKMKGAEEEEKPRKKKKKKPRPKVEK